MTLNTGVDYVEPDEWMGGVLEEDDRFWREPAVRNRWQTRFGEEVGDDDQLKLTGQAATDLGNAMTNVHQLTKGGTPSIRALYESTQEAIDSLYEDMLATVVSDATRALSFAVSHIPAKHDSKEPACTEHEVREIAAKLLRVHIASVFKNQVQMEKYTRDFSSTDQSGIDRNLPEEARLAMRDDLVVDMVLTSRAHMIRSIS
ncbi:hypothetical protein IAR50_000904 [Cryptococcus sp. DSM 104548]